MELDTDPLPLLSIFSDSSFVIGCLVVCILLLLSALVSGSEVAFFSLSPTDLENMQQDKSRNSKRVVQLLKAPKRLLATILIANNFINVGIVILSSYLLSMVFATSSISPEGQFIIQVIVVTFFILLIGEVIPKVYATSNGVSFAQNMSLPLLITKRLFSPLSNLLVKSTSFIDKRVKKHGSNVTIDHMGEALDIVGATHFGDQESKILRGIVSFGNIDVKQIMTPRMDVVSIDIREPLPKVIDLVNESGYSRIPVYEDNFDNVKGVLYIKDLLNHLDEKDGFKWSELMRKPYFVPENKKIDDLLREFQDQKVHISMVVDEYGGTSGIITLEDIIEEIVGEISDEFDDEDIIYSKLDEQNYVFEGKTPLIDLYRILNIDGDLFEEAKGDSDTLAGFLMEVSGKILKKNEKLDFENITFTIEAADKRRVKQIKVTIHEDVKEDM